MYLSKISIDNPSWYGAHQAVASSCPDQRYLYTILNEEEMTEALVLSPKPPCKFNEMQRLRDDFFNHQRYRFNIILNPVRHQNNKRLPVPHHEQIEWFFDKIETAGVQCELNSKQSLPTLTCNDHGNRVIIGRTKFSGDLDVQDREAFKKACINGIGRGRGFGCGWLQVIPLQG